VSEKRWPARLCLAFARTLEFPKPNFARITPDQWKALRELPASTVSTSKSIEPFTKWYHLTEVVRTDEGGKFAIVMSPENRFSALIAIDENRFALESHRFETERKTTLRAEMDFDNMPLCPRREVGA